MDLEHIFDDVLVPATVPIRAALDLPVDIVEEKDKIIIEAEIPGVKAKDISVEVDDDILTIEAKREEVRERETNQFTAKEIYRGHFIRAVTLPTPVQAEAGESQYENGILHIELPKRA